MLAAITPFSVVDFEGELACILWFAGCNMRCAYCHNPQFITASGDGVSINELESFLKSRQNLLSAVVFSGGECTLSSDFARALKLAKNLGFKTKVDSNASNSQIVEQSLKYIDFLALDFKAPKKKFSLVCGGDFYDNFFKTLKIALDSKTACEVRTTVHTGLLDENDISQMARELYNAGYRGEYFIQNYHKPENSVATSHHKTISEPHRKLNASLINSPLPIKLRNF